MSFQEPQKRLLTQEQLAVFQSSGTHQSVIEYIETLNEATVGTKLSDQCIQSRGLHAVLNVLSRVEESAKETPPIDNAGSRFGNPAFRTFYDKVSEIAPNLHDALPGLPKEAIPEISVYFQESWGNRTRIDYGSGMELNFLCWLLCLERLDVLTSEDHKAIVIVVFWRYIQVMRLLQSSYWLEPAGSHGVWGLDDYHFLPFLFGSAQLRGHKYIRPRAIHDSEIVEEYAKEYMYFACIQFINSVKSASLRWHSPMLDDISAVKTWDKVNSGMLKMYRAEVLGKLPVMQHFLFGSILPTPNLPAASPSNGDTHTHGHEGHNHPAPAIHPRVAASLAANGRMVPGEDTGDTGGAGQQSTGWGDCCGIPVPSAFGAAHAGKDGRQPGFQLQGPGIRPVPFD